MKAVIDEIKNVLVSNGYKETGNNEFFSDEFGDIKVTLIILPNQVNVLIKTTRCDDYGLYTSILTNNVTFYRPEENEYDMYDEHGTPEKILITAMNDFIQKKYYLEALMNGKELCVCEKPSFDYFHSTTVPF